MLIAGERITQVGPSGEVEVPAGARVLDGKDRWLSPGLWDMHVHTSRPERDLPLFLANGITGIRDMGGEADGNPARRPGTFSVAWTRLRRVRDDIDAGRALGPRLHAAGVMLDAPEPYPGTRAVADAGDARRIVRELLAEHVDFIKIGSGVTPEAFRAIIDEALAAATASPAQLLGLNQDTGTIAPGRRADLVLLERSPLIDIANTRGIQAVVLGGELLDRAALDRLLEAAGEAGDPVR